MRLPRTVSGARNDREDGSPLPDQVEDKLRGNDRRNGGNDRRKHSTPTLVLPPQGGGNIRIEIEITEKVDSRFRGNDIRNVGNDRKTERK